MDKLWTIVSVVVPIAVVFALMAIGWRNRRRRQSGIGELDAPPAELGEIARRDDLLYVATTRAGSPLDRIAVAGLGFRARAVVTVAATGIELDLAGRPAAFIPKSAIIGVGRATWTIDRAISGDGLVFVRWRHGDVELDSYVRSAKPADLVAAIEPLAPAPAEPPTQETAAA